MIACVPVKCADFSMQLCVLVCSKVSLLSNQTVRQIFDAKMTKKGVLVCYRPINFLKGKRKSNIQVQKMVENQSNRSNFIWPKTEHTIYII